MRIAASDVFLSKANTEEDVGSLPDWVWKKESMARTHTHTHTLTHASVSGIAMQTNGVGPTMYLDMTKVSRIFVR